MIPGEGVVTLEDAIARIALERERIRSERNAVAKERALAEQGFAAREAKLDEMLRELEGRRPEMAVSQMSQCAAQRPGGTGDVWEDVCDRKYGHEGKHFPVTSTCEPW